MAIERVGKLQEDQKAERALEEQRKREIQSQDSNATRDLSVLRVDESKKVTGEDRTTKAITEGGNHNAKRGADWQAYADRQERTVPVSVTEIATQNNANAIRVQDERNIERVRETERSNESRNDAQRDAVRRQAEQQLTVAEIQADIQKRTGIIKG